ncbi:hypothetical protein F2Q68_00034863 [Brassica cretica]|uniref:Uncharacterized protein n=1 Tax=Brassica cretica TaxID=69181 RepID=A0A8S9H9Y2_BRACR|nr:hypothetical protein F2Q68_00034863 [Brassica cretica]
MLRRTLETTVSVGAPLALCGSMIPQIKGRVWGHWAPTPVFPDSKEVGPAAPGGDSEVDQPLAPLGVSDNSI